MGLRGSILAYIRFFVFLSPIILPTMAVFGSLYESNLKGFIYILGLTLAMGLGKAIAIWAIKSPVPGNTVTTKGGTVFKPIVDPACNLLSSNAWGMSYGMPGPHALLLAFTATYLMFPMFLNNNVNLLIIGGLIFLMVLSGIMRVFPPMTCVFPQDVVVGWGTGFLLGTLWYFTVRGLSGDSKNITYFEEPKSDRQQCTLDKKSFRCKKGKPAT